MDAIHAWMRWWWLQRPSHLCERLNDAADAHHGHCLGDASMHVGGWMGDGIVVRISNPSAKSMPTLESSRFGQKGR